MTRPPWLHSLRTRLLLLALLPLLLLFAALLLYARHAHYSAAEEELLERARLASTTLAESLGTPMRAQDWRALRISLNAVLQADSSIAALEIYDLQNRLLLEVKSSARREPSLRSFGVGIRDPAIRVTPLQAGASTPIDAGAASVGTLRITFSTRHFMQRAQSKFHFDLAASLCALAISAALAWRMAQSLTRPLQAAVRALRALRQRDFDVQLAEDGPGEIGELQTSLNAMAASLDAATRELEATVETRTRDLLASRNEALQANEARRALLQRLHTIIEDERKGIALEIHDELNAVLIAMRLEAGRIAQLAQAAQAAQAAGGAASSAQEAALQQIGERAQTILQAAGQLYASARRLVRRLRPEMLEMLGLAGAVEEMLRHLQGHGCEFVFEAQGLDELGVLPEGIAISAYRIVQEAVSNIIKHAQAGQAKIQIRHADGELRIMVEDDGQGFAMDQDAPQSHGYGLGGIRERAAAWHGTAQVQSAPGKGCRWQISLPLADASALGAA